VTRWLRFARALALVGVAACGGAPAAETGGTPGGASPGSGNGTGGGSAPGGGPAVAATGPCACTCDSSSTNPPFCGALGQWECCDSITVEGPLPPPDLPA
jgi:hypothetical protein